MTDEEKAEKYALKVKYNFNAPMTQIDRVIESYLDGLAEGRKELDCYKAFESHCEEIEEDAKAIAKENEQLKKYIAKLEYLIRHHTDFIPIEGNENGGMYGMWKGIKMRIDM